MTDEKIALGKKLFFDGRIGGDRSTPCDACHLPDLGWSGSITIYYLATDSGSVSIKC